MNRYVLDTRTSTVHFPGIGRYVSQLARHLVPLLHQNEQLLLLHNPKDTGWPLPANSEKVTKIPTAVSPFSISQQWQIPKLLKQHQAASYHSAYYLMPYRPGIPTLLTLYDLIPEQFPQMVSPQARLLTKIVNKLALRAGDRFLAISEATRLAYLDNYKIDYAKITVVPLAADERFKKQLDSAVATMRQKLNLPDKYILYLGINKPHKNLARLIEAWHLVTKSLPNAPPLIIAGAWDSRYESVKTAVTHQHPIKFIGRVDDADLPALYTGATLFVFPSLAEGFGLPVLEAMACGTAVACANTSSLPEVGGDAVAYFDPTNVERIALTLQDLIQNDAKLTHMGQQGQLQAAKFSWEKTAESTLAQYRQLANKAQ